MNYVLNQLHMDNLKEDSDNEQEEKEVIEEVDSEPSSNEETYNEENNYKVEREENNDLGINNERKRALGRLLLHLRGNIKISE